MLQNSRRYLSFIIASVASFCGHIAQADGLGLISRVSGIDVARTAKLPENNTNPEEMASCGGFVVEPQTPAGKIVEDANWVVTTEVEKAGLTFITFAGQAQPATSGSCLLTDGNIGVFEGKDLLALIYTPASLNRSIGIMTKLDNGRLRVWDGDYINAPMADLQVFDRDLVIIHNVADRDTFCNEKFSAPNIFGLPIHIARRLVLAEDWQPMGISDREEGSYVADAQQEFPELQDCAGTGFGYCRYAYSKGKSNILTVITAGEAMEGSSPSVVRFEVECGSADEG